MIARLLFALSLSDSFASLRAGSKTRIRARRAMRRPHPLAQEQVTGHDFGQRVTTPEEIIRYLKALADAAPDRTRLVKYAESWEGRELYAIIIADADRIRRLDEVKAGLRRLAIRGSLAQSEAERLIKELPVVGRLLHGVHGNEISSGEAAMAEAYHLLAAQERRRRSIWSGVKRSSSLIRCKTRTAARDSSFRILLGTASTARPGAGGGRAR